jgi:GTPase SAR1 family protein
LDLQIWDTAGRELFHIIGTAFYRGMNACVLVFDVMNHETFEHVSSWRPRLVNRAEEFLFIIFANKCDLVGDRNIVRHKKFCYDRRHCNVSLWAFISVGSGGFNKEGDSATFDRARTRSREDRVWGMRALNC